MESVWKQVMLSVTELDVYLVVNGCIYLVKLEVVLNTTDCIQTYSGLLDYMHGWDL